MYEPTIAFGGNLGFDPELRFTPNGAAVCDLRVAATARRKVGEDWEDRETLWFKVSCWNQVAEHIAASFKKGDRVVVQGRLLQQTYTRTDGTTGTTLLVAADSVGADVARFPVVIKRPIRPGSSADVLTEKWADKTTGEIVDRPVEEELDSFEPLTEDEPIAV